MIVACRPRHDAGRRMLVHQPLANAEHGVVHRNVEELTDAGALGVADGGDHPEGAH